MLVKFDFSDIYLVEIGRNKKKRKPGEVGFAKRKKFFVVIKCISTIYIILKSRARVSRTAHKQS